ncbi:MAG: hypothetical protein AAF432_01655 [Planctomycetota bacterium]
MRANENQSQLDAAVTRRHWSIHLGTGAFLFFFIKGLVWLGIFAAAGLGLANAS